MRGIRNDSQTNLFSYVQLEDRIPANHPLRKIRQMVDLVLGSMNDVFEGLYSRVGRPSIPPEHLLRASLLQVLYTIRSERLLVEQLDYNLLFRWFVGLSADARVWDHSTFSQNRDRLFTEEQPDAGGRDFLGVLNPHSLHTVQAVVEPSLAAAQPEDRFQFERHGFFVADRREHQAGGRLVFNRIAGLKDSWSK